MTKESTGQYNICFLNVSRILHVNNSLQDQVVNQQYLKIFHNTFRERVSKKRPDLV